MDIMDFIRSVIPSIPTNTCVSSILKVIYIRKSINKFITSIYSKYIQYLYQIYSKYILNLSKFNTSIEIIKLKQIRLAYYIKSFEEKSKLSNQFF